MSVCLYAAMSDKRRKSVPPIFPSVLCCVRFCLSVFTRDEIWVSFAQFACAISFCVCNRILMRLYWRSLYNKHSQFVLPVPGRYVCLFVRTAFSTWRAHQIVKCIVATTQREPQTNSISGNVLSDNSTRFMYYIAHATTMICMVCVCSMYVCVCCWFERALTGGTTTYTYTHS